MKIRLLSLFGEVRRERSLIFQRKEQRRRASRRSFSAFELSFSKCLRFWTYCLRSCDPCRRAPAVVL